MPTQRTQSRVWERLQDPETGESGARPVVSLIRHGGEHMMVDLAFDDGSKLTATDGHPFWDVSTGLFTEAVDLMVGEQVLTLDGQSLKIISVRVHGEDLTAYNLEIEGIHTYYAGPTPVLVHNDCRPDFDVDGTTYASGDRVTARAVEEPGPFHNFPSSFDESIVRDGSVNISSSGYTEYSLAGTVNEHVGSYQIGGFMNAVGDFFEITHRFFKETY